MPRATAPWIRTVGLGWASRPIEPETDWARKMAAASCVIAPPEQRTATDTNPNSASVVRNEYNTSQGLSERAKAMTRASPMP